MRNKIVIAAVALIFVFGGTGRADVVQLDLLSLGMPATFNDSSPSWQTNFDLGVTFTEISHVYIDWSGEITAGLEQKTDPAYHPIGDPFPIDVGILASLGGSPYPRMAKTVGGEATYPNPEAFNCQSGFKLWFDTTWSDMLDGKGNFEIEYTTPIPLYGWVVEGGSIVLNSATLVVDGTVVPEPATLLLLGVGGFLLRKRN